jgi:hypothetical protein
VSIELLLEVIDGGFDKKAWHGPTLRGALRGVGAPQAAWRASPRSHNIWELAVHAAYWKYAVRRLITGEKRGSFPLDGSNWFERPERPGRPLERSWRGDLQLLAREHQLLKAAVAALPDRALKQRAPGKAYSLGFAIRGIAAHDLYHAGQVQLLKRLYKDARLRPSGSRGTRP